MKNSERATLGGGCFWCLEAIFNRLRGVSRVEVGYSGGGMPNPAYQDVCAGGTGHAEVVRVIFDPKVMSYRKLLDAFWMNHDPTQKNRQGNDVGSQYRSVIFYHSEEQKKEAHATAAAFQKKLTEKGYGKIATEISEAPTYYFAEDYHQQYLHKNPGGYCGLGGTGVSCPVGLTPTD